MDNLAKKIFMCLVAIVCVATSTMFSACSDDDDDRRVAPNKMEEWLNGNWKAVDVYFVDGDSAYIYEEHLGEWYYADAGVYGYLTFNLDGFICYSNAHGYFDFGGDEYKVEGDKLFVGDRWYRYTSKSDSHGDWLTLYLKDDVFACDGTPIKVIFARL